MSDESNLLVVPVDPSGAEYLSFAPAPSGWAIYLAPHQDFGGDRFRRLFVRFGPADTSERAKIVAQEVHIAFAQSLGGRALRDIPLARLEAAVNQPAYYAAVRQRLMPANVVIGEVPGGAGEWLHAKPMKVTSPNLKLVVPDGRPKPDDFYRQVAAIFGYLTTVSQRPANELAEANDVRTTTVHGWVKEARKRGFLASGERARRALVEIVKNGDEVEVLGVHRLPKDLLAEMRDQLEPDNELLLREVSRAYRIAEMDGKDPLGAVADDFGITKGEAQAWVTRSKDGGYFDSQLIRKSSQSGGGSWPPVSPST